MERGSASQAARPSSRAQNSCSRTHTGRNGAMVSSRENVRKTGQVPNLSHGLGFIRKLKQIEVGVRNHHKLSLSADPSSHVDVTVCTTGARRVHIETNSRL